ncbi:hypothetical protein F4808DRAFT_331062 [Astrocystis sublimbata]|nr:hypothetical protein F4808DRAFT_331062 [Astrocystis sublimbata]
MAKSSRASSRKANNQRLKANVFGPIEIERNARLSAKLLELAAAPKPERPESDTMNVVEDDNAATDGAAEKNGADAAADESKPDFSSHRSCVTLRFESESLIVSVYFAIAAMDVDAAKTAAAPSKPTSKKGRIEKRRKTSKIVFPKYGDKAKVKRKH